MLVNGKYVPEFGLLTTNVDSPMYREQLMGWYQKQGEIIGETINILLGRSREDNVSKYESFEDLIVVEYSD